MSLAHIDRLLIARLSLDIDALSRSNDPDSLMILAGLPEGETVFEYLVGCWKRLYISNREMARSVRLFALKREFSLIGRRTPTLTKPNGVTRLRKSRPC